MRPLYLLLLIVAFYGISFSMVGADAVPPELPRVFITTTYNAAESGTCNVTVPSGGNVQAALDAIPNQNTPYVVCLAAGGTFKRFDLKNKSGNAWITIRTSTPDSQFVQPGKRVSPADASKMAKVQSGFDTGGYPAIRATAGAHNYRLIGLELVMAPADQILNCPSPCSYYTVYNLFEMGAEEKTYEDLPKDIIADRMYIHGEPGREVRRGVAMNGVRNSVIDSYISEIHQREYDTQAVGAINGPGPLKISNNYLEAAGENILIGGSGTAYLNGANIPSDIEITNNYIFKPLSWRNSQPRHSSWSGYNYVVKNLLELKTGIRVLIEGNVLENVWPEEQNGDAVLIALVDDFNKAPEHLNDITIRKNKLKNMAGGVLFGSGVTGKIIKRMLIENNIFTEITGEESGKVFVYQNSDSVNINHNTAINSKSTAGALGMTPLLNFEFKNNLIGHGNYGLHGLSGITPHIVSSNLLVLTAYDPNDGYSKPEYIATVYPSGNKFVINWSDVGFKNYAGGDYELSPSSPYKNKGTDGKDIGADIPAVLAATQNTISGGSTYTPPASSPVLVPVSAPNPVPVIVPLSLPENSPIGIPQNSTTVYASPLAVDFGALNIGLESVTKRVSVFNKSSINISSVSFVVSGDYAVKLNFCHVGIASQTHCDIYVAFKPIASGVRTGSITFTESGVSGSPQTVTLTGVGNQIVQPAPPPVIVTLPPVDTTGVAVVPVLPQTTTSPSVEALQEQIKSLTALVQRLMAMMAEKTSNSQGTAIPPPLIPISGNPTVGNESSLFTRSLSLRMNGTDVRSLQQFLNKQGFLVSKTGLGSPGNETTGFGMATYNALRRYQSSVGLPPTGFFGPSTREYINNMLR